MSWHVQQSSRSESGEEEKPIDGVQLRGHDGRGGTVPRPSQPQHQHDPDGRRGGGGGIAAQLPAQLLLRVLRGPQPRRRRRGQVRVRARDPRRVVQVPAPPHQLPGPRPPAPVPAGLPRRAGAGRLVFRFLPHRRGPVSVRGQRRARRGESEKMMGYTCRVSLSEGKEGRYYSLPLVVIRAVLPLPPTRFLPSCWLWF
jgi:hypothetical protein